MKKLLIALFCLCVSGIALAKSVGCPMPDEIKIDKAGIGRVTKLDGIKWFSTSFIAKNSRLSKLIFVTGIADKNNLSVIDQIVCQYTSGGPDIYVLAYITPNTRATIDIPDRWEYFNPDKKSPISAFCIPAKDDPNRCNFTFE